MEQDRRLVCKAECVNILQNCYRQHGTKLYTQPFTHKTNRVKNDKLRQLAYLRNTQQSNENTTTSHIHDRLKLMYRDIKMRAQTRQPMKETLNVQLTDLRRPLR